MVANACDIACFEVDVGYALVAQILVRDVHGSWQAPVVSGGLSWRIGERVLLGPRVRYQHAFYGDAHNWSTAPERNVNGPVFDPAMVLGIAAWRDDTVEHGPRLALGAMIAETGSGDSPYANSHAHNLETTVNIEPSYAVMIATGHHTALILDLGVLLGAPTKSVVRVGAFFTVGFAIDAEPKKRTSP